MLTRTTPDPFVDWLPTVPGSPAALRLAVKDVIDVAGLPTGAGHPLWLATHTPAERDADCVALLRAAGATVVGKTHTDELAYSLGGTNAHYGAPANPAAPDRTTGGSSSGTAAAVAQGRADLGLGTDTAGSIRVPAAFCGLYGFRPSHARVSRVGVVPLAPSFDVPGLLARRPAALLTGANALLAGSARPKGDPANGALHAPADLWSLAEPETAQALDQALALLRPSGDIDRSPLFPEGPQTLERLRTAFSTLQAWEAWQAHRDWIEHHRPEFGPGVAQRFRTASKVTSDQASSARNDLASAAPLLERLLGSDGLLVLPTAPAPAPLLHRPTDPGRRSATLLLTCLASAAGAPALSIPGAHVAGAPVGLCLVAAPGRDELLLRRLAACAPTEEAVGL